MELSIGKIIVLCIFLTQGIGWWWYNKKQGDLFSKVEYHSTVFNILFVTSIAFSFVGALVWISTSIAKYW